MGNGFLGVFSAGEFSKETISRGNLTDPRIIRELLKKKKLSKKEVF